MFVIDEVVFYHFFKCAGSSIGKSLVDQRRDDLKFYKSHASPAFLPDDFKDYRAISLVRNPIDWYESFINYEINRRNKNLEIMQLSRIICYENYPEKTIADFDVIFDRMINFREFFKEGSPARKHFEYILTSKNQHPILKNLFPNAKNIVLEDTYLQFMYRYFGLAETEMFHMETQMKDVLDILKLEEGCYVNKTGSKTRLSNKQRELIKSKDKWIFEEFGYAID
jgi:hypothetical protein